MSPSTRVMQVLSAVLVSWPSSRKRATTTMAAWLPMLFLSQLEHFASIASSNSFQAWLQVGRARSTHALLSSW